MGNRTFKEFKEKSIGKGSMDGSEAYAIAPVTDKEITLIGKSKGMTGRAFHYIDPDTEDVVYASKSNLSGKKSVLYNKEDQAIAFQVSKTSFKKKKMWVYKPSPVFEGQTASEEKFDDNDSTTWYLAAYLEATDTMTTAECTVKVIIGEDADDKSGFKYEALMKSYKISTMGFNAYVEDMNKECLAKCTPKSKMSISPLFVLAPGTDPAYIFSAIAGCNPGGGSSAGALAGAGVI
mmetsp:Transcript_16943/g.23974  ORF Transcript_16943/g.23974 Transcript_16943/m.23974 type:complete len:235 (-) Transcript_16943:191-895(-)|eukprot:CAMPEP_0184864388 /NCGR_PEP_ID=MMETSP0580-20130426/14782_1 /TAXON_ID=1118495 /ORGANISM="Dactyliosolen fragilissimus" /LENGTH=234 /DNA_ID=CAMNT_0027363143 /DNA_START=75 /DNA_END=779 /DNA_ORIENTATION=+